MDKYLDEVEMEAIGAFITNATMREAVRKVLLAGIYENGTLKKGEPADPLQNFALGLFFANQSELISNEQLGQDLRASAMGIHALESAFQKMVQFAPKPEPEEPSDVNPGA